MWGGFRIESDMEGRPASILSKYDQALPEEVGPTHSGGNKGPRSSRIRNLES